MADEDSVLKSIKRIFFPDDPIGRHLFLISVTFTTSGTDVTIVIEQAVIY